MPQVNLDKSENVEYFRRGIAHAPANCPSYRGWATWYDFGEFETGICFRETKWRAQRGEDRLEQDGYYDLRDLIDQIEVPADDGPAL